MCGKREVFSECEICTKKKYDISWNVINYHVTASYIAVSWPLILKKRNSLTSFRQSGNYIYKYINIFIIVFLCHINEYSSLNEDKQTICGLYCNNRFLLSGSFSIANNDARMKMENSNVFDYFAASFAFQNLCITSLHSKTSQVSKFHKP